MLRSLVGRASLPDLLSDQRTVLEREALAMLRERLKTYDLGLDARSLAIQEVHPPLAVVQAYRDVSDAQLERERRVNEGQMYSEEQTAIARGREAVLKEQAHADRLGSIQKAGGEADGFLRLLKPRALAPVLSDHERFWSTMADLLANRHKVILDAPDSKARRHLILPDPSLGTFPSIDPTPALLPSPSEGHP